MARDQEPMTEQERKEAREGIRKAFEEAREDMADEPRPDGGE